MGGVRAELEFLEFGSVPDARLIDEPLDIQDPAGKVLTGLLERDFGEAAAPSIEPDGELILLGLRSVTEDVEVDVAGGSRVPACGAATDIDLVDSEAFRIGRVG